jgi:hypothetical protein
MWFVPTRQRPDRLQTFLDACEITAMVMPGLIIVDGADGGDYSSVRVPHNWRLQVGPKQLETCGRMDDYFHHHPYARFYSIVNDDVVPLTFGWDCALALAAGDWNVAYPDDCNNGVAMATQFVVGGKLARAVGSLGLGFLHTMVDRAWMDIGRNLGRLVYRPDIQLRHDHWTTGRGNHDGVYRKTFNGESTIPHDRARYDQWLIDEFPALIDRLSRVVPPPVEEVVRCVS